MPPQPSPAQSARLNWALLMAVKTPMLVLSASGLKAAAAKVLKATWQRCRA
jgi:hypothetical protein